MHEGTRIQSRIYMCSTKSVSVAGVTCVCRNEHTDRLIQVIILWYLSITHSDSRNIHVKANLLQSVKERIGYINCLGDTRKYLIEGLSYSCIIIAQCQHERLIMMIVYTVFCLR